MKHMLSRSIRQASIVLLCLVYAWFMSPLAAAQFKDPLSYPFYDPASNGSCSPQANATPTINPSELFMIGDSITRGAKTVIESTLRSRGVTAVVDGFDSRSLSTGTSQLNGQSVLAASTAEIQASGAVVIALGTNGGLSATSIETAVNTVREANPKISSSILWVNVGLAAEKRTQDPIDPTGTNSILKSSSASLNFKLVDWASLVAQHPEYINDDGYGVHTSEEGSQAFADAIAAALSGASSGGCGGDVTGCDVDEAAVWQFFEGKGLGPHMIASFMGNMYDESHLEPRLVEYGWQNSRGEISQAGDPTSLDEQIPPEQYKSGGSSGSLYVGPRVSNGDQLGGGYGLIQFTSPGRKDHLQQVADRMNRSPCDLGAQLETIWEELEGDYLNSTLNPVKASTDIRDAVTTIVYNYEIPGNKPAAVARRVTKANEYLAQYGSGGQ